MARFSLSRRRADVISNGVGLIGLGIVFYLNAWWPGILLVIWASLATREYLTGRIWDLTISSFLFIGLFTIYYLNVDWSALMPVLFFLGGIYIIFREFFYAEDTNGIEKSQEIKDDIDDIKG